MPCSEERTGVAFDLTPGKRCQRCGEPAVIVTAFAGKYSQWCEDHALDELGRAGSMLVRRLA